MSKPPKLAYPRSRKVGYSERFYPYKARWFYEVHHEPRHPEGQFVAVDGGFRGRFSSTEEAKSFCEGLYELNENPPKMTLV